MRPPRLVLALLVLLPLLALAALDRAIVHWTGPFRVEALLRTIPPGRANVLVVGSSRAGCWRGRSPSSSRLLAPDSTSISARCGQSVDVEL
jgi:hypothetical protein